MKSAISRHNQSGLKLDDEAVRTIQAASRPDWSPSEQLVLVTIPDVSKEPVSLHGRERAASAVRPAVPFEPSLWSEITTNAAATTVATAAAAALPIPQQQQPVEPVSPVREMPEVSDAAALSMPVPAIAESEEKPAAAQARVASPVEQSRAQAHSAIVESLLARFGTGPSCLIHFCDIDQPQRAAEVCLSIGMEFADRTQRRVLLLDLSRTTRPLSGQLGVELAAGFREVVRTQLNWRNLVRPTSNPLVDILPAGVVKLNNTATRADYELAMRRLIGELVQHYGGICSCSDTAFDLETELVGLCSSGGFLTMDFQRTSRRLAKSAANHLQISGTRLLGCIAAKAPI